MLYTSRRWYYFEQEDCYLALICNELYQSLPRSSGALDPEFWLVDWAELDKEQADRFRTIVKKLEPLSYTNEQWYPYEEDGSYYQLERGILRQCPMNSDGTRDNSPCRVEWSCVEAEDRPRMREIIAELRTRP